MRSLSASELLTVWEQGLTQPWLQRGLSLLALACPERALDQLAQISIGERDRHLLRLREALFGSQFASVVDCPACGDRLELNFSTSEIWLTPEIELSNPISATIADYKVQFRLPNSSDLVAVFNQAPYQTNDANDERLQRQLLEQCLLHVQHHDVTIAIEDLTPSTIAAITTAMSQADPQADVELALSCPACQHGWSTSFDIVSFLWSELQNWAQRLLRDIHVIASTYGWSEAEILAMSGQRRQCYLEMIGK